MRELLGVCDFNNNKLTISSPFDMALFEFAKECRYQNNGREVCYRPIEEIEFNSSNKYHVRLFEPIVKANSANKEQVSNQAKSSDMIDDVNNKVS